MTAARIVVLGAAAGGGLPQWNCSCTNCTAARKGDIPQSTQSSIAVTANGADWAIINASPDIRTQLTSIAAMHPSETDTYRDTPIRSVLVTNGDIDHIAGLLILREKQPFRLLATGHIHEVFDQNPLFDALDRELVTREIVSLDAAFELVTGVQASLFSVPGKVPLFMESGVVDTELEGEQTVGVHLHIGDQHIFYIPGCAKITPALRARLAGADVLLFDGTVWENDEMPRLGVGAKTGARMGHMSMHGPTGTMHVLKDVEMGRRIFVHLNNTNPVWQPASPERAEAKAQGWDIAYDGMEITL